MSILNNIKRGKQQRPQRVIIYGPEGVGKSTLAAGLPAPLFLDTEEGTQHMNVGRSWWTSTRLTLCAEDAVNPVDGKKPTMNPLSHTPTPTAAIFEPWKNP